jgi:PilZ domain/Gram-negative bacterial TonB protein C-terminal
MGMSSTRGSIKGFFESLSERRDRRAYTRSNSPLVTYIDLGDGNGGIALNISEGGLAITAAGMLFADYFPSIRFQLPKVPSWIETSGRVVWVGDSKKAAGISFENITEVDRERIRHWISSQVCAEDEIEQGIGYLAENNKQPLENSAPGSRRNLTTPRKLEVLSEADEARFAAMFPSESTLHLQTPSAHNWTETEVERDVQERVGQKPGEFLEGMPTPHSVREGAKSTSESSVENTEAVPQSFGEESELGSGDAGAASDAPAPASESVDTVVFPRRRWIIDRSDNARKTEDEAIGEYAVAQFEAPDSSLDQKHRFPDRSAGLSLAEQEESQVIQESPKESIPAEEKTPGECALPTFTYPQETDWRQQFNWSRGPTATQSISRQVAEAVPERSNLPLIAGLGILIASVCFAAGLMLGTGSMRRLLRFNGEIPNSSSDVSPGTSSGNSNQIVARAPEQQSSNSSSDVPTNTSASGSPGVSHGATSVQPPKGPRTYPSETPNTGNELKAPANHPVPETENEDAPSDASSSSDLREGSNDNSEDRKPGLPPSKPVVPETKTRPESPANGKQQGDYETTVDKPYSEVRRPILVTPPDEKSGPFRLAFPEVAVSASGALAISAQRFVLVPTLPGPASAHPPARLQAGVLIYHVDPVPPAGSGDIGGTVKVRATIGKGGDVVDVRAISGPPSLIPRVVRAVREWRYTVTLLDGQPLGAEEEVVVEFRPRR